MILQFIFLIVGLVLILVGADALVNGASTVARKYGISEFVVGLTIVGIGTSAPELVVSVMSAINGSSDIAIGNVVGSNISNVFMILGITALISPIALTKENIKYDLPISIGVSLLLFFLAYDTIFLGKQNDIISRLDGVILLICLIHSISMIIMVSAAPGCSRLDMAPGTSEAQLWRAGWIAPGPSMQSSMCPPRVW